MKTTSFLIVFCLFFGITVVNAQPKYDFVVATDGSGNFTSINEAINACRVFMPQTRVIFIKNGTYHEKVVIESSQTNVHIIGESVENTVISWDDFADRNKMGTFKTSTVKVMGSDITIENITIENTAGKVGQAVALHVEGDRVIIRNCRLLGNQDTLYAAGLNSRQLYKDCYIEGTTDFIFGAATALFDKCTIHSKQDSYITAASTPQGRTMGYVFMNCKLTAAEGISKVYLGRPWRDFAQTVFIQCEMGSHILPVGWHNWSAPEREKTTFYGEYKSSGLGANAEKRANWSHQLTNEEILRYNIASILAPLNQVSNEEQNWLTR